jgi:hypothetical protein
LIGGGGSGNKELVLFIFEGAGFLLDDALVVGDGVENADIKGLLVDGFISKSNGSLNCCEKEVVDDRDGKIGLIFADRVSLSVLASSVVVDDFFPLPSM